ncbi:MAG: glycosyltransferase family 39 protein [Actinomycetota bacterium]
MGYVAQSVWGLLSPDDLEETGKLAEEKYWGEEAVFFVLRENDSLRPMHPRGVFSPRQPAIFLGLILVVGATLAASRIGFESLWWDEAASYWIASARWGDLWTIITTQDLSMGLYHVFLHFWVKLGDGEAFLRLPSLLFASGSIFLTYLLGKELFGKGHGLVAAALLAVNAFLIDFSREARGYTLLLFLLTATALYLTRAVRGRSARDWVIAGVLGFLSITAHAYAVLFLIGFVVSLPAARFHGTRSLSTKQLGTIGALVLVFVMGVLVVVGPVIEKATAGVWDWIPELTFRSAVGQLGTLLGGGDPWLAARVALLALPATTLGVAALRRRGPSFETWRYVFLFSWLLLPLVTGIVISLVYRPVFVPRYFIGILPALTLLLVVSVGALRPRWLSFLGVLILIGLALFGVVKWEDADQRQDWRSVTHHVLSRTHLGDGILFSDREGAHSFSYYVEQQDAWTSAPEFVYPPISWATRADASRITSAREALRMASRELPANQRVWQVWSPDSLRTEVRDYLDSRYRWVRGWRFSGIEVALYVVQTTNDEAGSGATK